MMRSFSCCRRITMRLLLQTHHNASAAVQSCPAPLNDAYHRGSPPAGALYSMLLKNSEGLVQPVNGSRRRISVR